MNAVKGTDLPVLAPRFIDICPKQAYNELGNLARQAPYFGLVRALWVWRWK